MDNFSLVKSLIAKKLTISFAESITGGMLVKLITDCPGSSNVLKESYITYSNESKIKILNVNKNTIKECGVVSKEVSIEMVRGLKSITNSDICVSVTGNAGPSVCDDKPVGRVYYSIAFKDDIITEELNIKNENIKDDVEMRDFIRVKTSECIINNLSNIINNA